MSCFCPVSWILDGIRKETPIKILATTRAGRVVRQVLFTPKTINANQRRRGISVSKEDKKKANLKTSSDKLFMLVCANFSPGDWWVTLTYDDEHLPQTRQESQKPFRKFMRKFRKYRKDNGDVFKYVYCTQVTTENGGRRVHHHMITRWEDSEDRKKIEEFWEFGPIKKIVRLKDIEHIKTESYYMCREPRELGVYVPGEQMWTPSRGLDRPKPQFTVIDNDSVDINVPVGCRALDVPVQIPGYGGYKSILYEEL